MNNYIIKDINKNFFKKHLIYFYCMFGFIIALYISASSIYSMSYVSSSKNDILIEMHQIVKQINTSPNNELITKEYINNKVIELENRTIFNLDYDIISHKEGHMFTIEANIKNNDIFFLFKPFFHDMSFKSQELLFITNGTVLENLADPFN